MLYIMCADRSNEDEIKHACGVSTQRSADGYRRLISSARTINIVVLSQVAKASVMTENQ